MAKMVVKRIGILSAAKISGITGAGIGLIFGLIYGLILMTVGAAMMTQNEGAMGAGVGIVGGLAMIILIPAFYGAFGFIFGAIYAVIYNIAAGFVGGMEMELESAEQGYLAPPPPQPQWDPASTYQTPGLNRY
ncbi:MAG: hypothetical protein M3458_03740 [Acidobacteriota bacterium]|nr:hypothetical protein [Acidobacteriota bacterium]